MLTIKDEGETIVIEESISFIKKAIANYKKELTRQRIKSAKKYVPTGNPSGRPKNTANTANTEIDEIKIDDEIILNPE